jgi:hypothetical protein
VIAAVPHLNATITITTTRVELPIINSETRYNASMSCKSLDETISAATPDLDGTITITTTRVQLAIIDNETSYTISMPGKSSNVTIIVAIRHSNVSTIIRLSVQFPLTDERME